MMRNRQIESVGIGMVGGLAVAGMATDDNSRFQGEQQEASWKWLEPVASPAGP